MHNDLLYILALTLVDGIGPASGKKLMQHLGSAEAVFRASRRDLLQVPGINESRAEAILSFQDFARAEGELRWCEKHGVEPIPHMAKAYPNRLKHCDDGPLLLYRKGPADLSAPRMVSMVGTRRISEHGKHTTRQLVEAMVSYGVTIVSGLAYGVDIEAHKAALDVGLPTIAVLGHGLNRIYPAAHARYAAEMTQRGALLTEFTTATKPDRENFPMRNRIVAGMCDATIVVESGESGGSMITADLANGYSRDVFAIPGRIHDDRSAGCNLLIKSHRASLLSSVKDLEYVMGWSAKPSGKPMQRKIFVDLHPNEEKLMACMREKGRVQIDEISLATQMPMSSVMVHLLNLELNGLVRALPGKLYEPC
jgi:DNA processing protein